MNYTIIGAGAVGMLLASYLAEQGDVTIVVRRQQQAQQLNAEGITKINQHTTTHHRVQAVTTIPNNPQQHIFICTKAYALRNIIEQLQHIEAATITACPNGLAHVEPLQQLPNSCVAVVEFGALKESDTMVHHTGVGRVVIGAITSATLPPLQQTTLLPVEHTTRIEAIVWRKALLNCLINPLTAIMHVRNGELVTNDYLWRIVQQVYHELVVALPQYMELVPLEAVQQLCQKTAQNYSSMCVDVAHGRVTEIEEIVGAVLQAASQALPTLETLYYQVKSKS